MENVWVNEVEKIETVQIVLPNGSISKNNTIDTI